MTRALQSTLFQNTGGSPERDRAEDTVGVVAVAGRYFPFLILDTREYMALQTALVKYSRYIIVQ